LKLECGLRATATADWSLKKDTQVIASGTLSCDAGGTDETDAATDVEPNGGPVTINVTSLRTGKTFTCQFDSTLGSDVSCVAHNTGPAGGSDATDNGVPVAARAHFHLGFPRPQG
jgi:hypothetical protein